MTDFVQDLERQLVAAARRRHARRRRRGLGRLAMPALPGRLMLGAVAALAVVVVSLAALTRSETPVDDRAIGGPPVPPEETFPFTLPHPGTFTTCEGLSTPGSRPESVVGARQLLGVLRRAAKPFAWNPDLAGDSLLPVTSYRRRDVRGMRVQGVDLLVVPSGGVTRAHCDERKSQAPRAGVCLVTRREALLATRCWTMPDIVEGRAITMAARRDWIAGVVPDGIGTVELQRPGAKGAYLAVVKDNVFVAKVPGARRGLRLDVTLRGRGGPRIAFLNGTTNASAARAVEKRLRATGYRFRTAAIGDAVTRTQATTRIYRTSRTGTAARDAVDVAGRLGIQDLYEVTEDVRTLAPEADVFVLVGKDRATSRPPEAERGSGGYAPPAEHKGGGQ